MIPPFQELRAAIETHQSFLVAAHVGPDGMRSDPGWPCVLRSNRWAKRPGWYPAMGAAVVPLFAAVAERAQRADQAFGLRHHPRLQRPAESRRRTLSVRRTRRVSRAYRSPPYHRTGFSMSIGSTLPNRLPRRCSTACWRAFHPISADIAQCLFCGISTDTAIFGIPNTTPECLQIAGRLVELGANLPGSHLNSSTSAASSRPS